MIKYGVDIIKKIEGTNGELWQALKRSDQEIEPLEQKISDLLLSSHDGTSTIDIRPITTTVACLRSLSVSMREKRELKGSDTALIVELAELERRRLSASYQKLACSLSEAKDKHYVKSLMAAGSILGNPQYQALFLEAQKTNNKRIECRKKITDTENKKTGKESEIKSLGFFGFLTKKYRLCSQEIRQLESEIGGLSPGFQAYSSALYDTLSRLTAIEKDVDKGLGAEAQLISAGMSVAFAQISGLDAIIKDNMTIIMNYESTVLNKCANVLLACDNSDDATTTQRKQEKDGYQGKMIMSSQDELYTSLTCYKEALQLKTQAWHRLTNLGSLRQAMMISPDQACSAYCFQKGEGMEQFLEKTMNDAHYTMPERLCPKKADYPSSAIRNTLIGDR